MTVSTETVVKTCIQDLIAERDALKAQVEDLLSSEERLRAEALAWHAKADGQPPAVQGGQRIRITIETNDTSVGQWLEDLVVERIGLRKKVEELSRLNAELQARLGANPYVSPED